MTDLISPPPTQPASVSLQTSDGDALKTGGVTFRAALLSLALAFFFGYMIPVVDMKMRNTFLGATHLPPGAIAVLLVVLLALNPLLSLIARDGGKTRIVAGVLLACASVSGFCFLLAGMESLLFWLFGAAAVILALVLGLGRKPFTRNETLTIYISCLFSTLAPGHGAENVFVVNLIGPFYYATRENKWLDFLQPYIKPWMTPALSQGGGYEKNEVARGVVSGWFNNVPDGQVPWGAWLVPLIVWGTAIGLMYIMMACICVIIRKQWAEREALAFPLLRLPLELTEDVNKPQNGALGTFFRNPMMWIGFGIAVFIQTLRGLNLYFPDVPTFPLGINNTSQLFTEAPWNQMAGLQMTVWPIVVGISYLLTSEISFSFWFFYLFIKMQLVGAYLLGFNPNTLPRPTGGFGADTRTFTFYQQIGCYLAYVALMAWTGREHLRHIALRAFGRRPHADEESEEALSYPVAFWGFVLSFGALVAWSIAAGLSAPLAFLQWGLYLVIIIALTRIISEAGILFVQQGWVPLGTIGQLTNAGPDHWLLNAHSLPPAAMIQGGLMTDLRGFIMPSFIQGFKLAHDRKIPLKPLLALTLACSLIAAAMGTFFNVKYGYQLGGTSLDPWYAGSASQLPATTAASLVKGVPDASYGNLIWVGLGAFITYIMMLARSRFAWFPLHPIGLLISQTYPMATIWFSIFIGWLFKILVMRFGGTDSYRKTTPLFLGLALGDVTMMLFWLVVDGYYGRVGHKLMPG
ncbi:hypothetical protein IAD21_00804 [Abditibacteriota bacterium]|nr:hypothetical protein IAD21_00804 [Abditibacteriota bacterium]